MGSLLDPYMIEALLECAERFMCKHVWGGCWAEVLQRVHLTTQTKKRGQKFQ